MSNEQPIDVVLFCPQCFMQHIDKAEPDVCELCGEGRESHPEIGKVRRCQQTGQEFTSWLNPPHKSHRCHKCNFVWRPADVPTNGVLKPKTVGSNDTLRP
jgi:hypothetical protein